MVYINTTGKVNQVWLDKPYGTVIIDCPDCPDSGDTWESGYTSGYTDGLEACSGTSATIQSHKDVVVENLPLQHQFRRWYYYKEQTILPDSGYDGLGRVALYVDLDASSAITVGYDSGFTDGYDSGYTDGYNDGYDLGEEMGFDDGYDSGYTDGRNATSPEIWQDGYNSGYTDGEHDGYQDGFDDGYLDGEAHGYELGFPEGYESGATDQKEKLAFISISGNGTYTRADGWSSVTVNVPQTATTDADLIANLQGDYYVIPSGTTHLRNYAFHNTCFSSITIPTTVTGVGDNAFYYNDCLVDITFPNSVTTIGRYALGNCHNLTAVTLPSGITDIPGYLFYGDTALTRADIPTTVTGIGMYAFYRTPFSSLTISDAVTTIGNNAFSSMPNLTAITLPSGLTEIASGLFQGCASLTGVTIPEGVTYIDRTAFYHNNSLSSLTIPASVTGLADMAIYVGDGDFLQDGIIFEGLVPPVLGHIQTSLGWVQNTFPIYVPCAVVEDYKTAFGQYYAPRITCNSGQTMPTGITLTVDSAITDSGQATATLEPNGSEGNIIYTSSDDTIATVDQNGNITVLSSGTVTICAYDSRSGLEDCKTITVSKTEPLSGISTLDFVYETTGANQTIHLFAGSAGDSNQYFYAFYSALTDVIIDGVSVGKDPNNIHVSYPRTSDYYFYTFETPGLHNVKYYVQRSFSAGTDLGMVYPGLRLQDLLFSSNLGETPIVYANIGEGYVDVKHGAFQGNMTLSAVTFPNTLTGLTTYPFQYSGLKTVTIPDSVTEILGTYEAYGFAGSGPFDNCYLLSSVTIGSGVTRLGIQTFKNCSGLTDLTVKAVTPPTVTTGNSALLFDGCTSLAHIYVPAGSVNTYKEAAKWSDYAGIIEAIQ